MKTGIYMIRNKVNNKAYIGQAIDIDARWVTHINELNDNKHHNRYLQRAWNKYGEDNFEFTIIHECEEELLDELEIMYIAHYHTFYKDGGGGYNLTLGGDGCRGYKYTDEQLAYRQSDEYRKIHSEALNRPEVKAKIIEFMKEYYKDPENRKKKSEAMNRPEVKAKLSKKVYCTTNDTIYVSTVEAGEKLGIDNGYISYCCRGKYITKRYPDGHHYKKGRFKDSPVYEFWFLSEYEEKFGKVAD